MRISIIIAVLLMFNFYSKSQQQYLEQIVAEHIEIVKDDNETLLNMDVDFSTLTIDKNHLLIITPIITSTDLKDSLKLDPIVIVGGRRHLILSRQEKNSILQDTLYTIVRKNGTNQQLHYTASAPFSAWQRKADLSFKAKVTGCADCLIGETQKIIVDKILADEFKPNFVMNYIIPDVEPIKQRSEEYSAHLNYAVGKHELIPTYGNNTAELNKVDRSINTLKMDPDLTITNLTITGYASPEGASHSNLLLSQRRAEAFASYLVTKYGYERSQFNINWQGEDWNGLRRAIEESNIVNKQSVLNIIDNTPNVDERDKKIIALDNRETYNLLLKEYYPSLRRNDYKIAFISRAFNVNEAKEILSVAPKKLSLNEMYIVAQTYPKDSEEFRQIFDIAAQTFPESEVAAVNASITDLNNNNIDAAILRLNKLSEQPKVMSLLGMAYIKNEEYGKALEYLKKAADQGDKDARHNLQQLQILLEDK